MKQTTITAVIIAIATVIMFGFDVEITPWITLVPATLALLFGGVIAGLGWWIGFSKEERAIGIIIATLGVVDGAIVWWIINDSPNLMILGAIMIVALTITAWATKKQTLLEREEEVREKKREVEWAKNG